MHKVPPAPSKIGRGQARRGWGQGRQPNGSARGMFSCCIVHCCTGDTVLPVRSSSRIFRGGGGGGGGGGLRGFVYRVQVDELEGVLG